MDLFFESCKKIIKDAISVFWVMVKTMVPVMIVIRIGLEFGLVEKASVLLEPLMAVLGLPAEAGLVLAMGFLLNIYSAVAVLLGILPSVQMSVADVTVLLSIVLIAHALPLEQSISRRAGLSFVFSASLRLVIGFTYGILLNLLYSVTHTLQQPVQLTWLPFEPTFEETWIEWAWSSLSLLFSLFWIILGLIILLKVFELARITNFIGWLLSPWLKLMGISKDATSITMVGVLLGLSYGGGLIIREAQQGKIGAKDVVLSLSFMGLCHSLIEDPLIMMAFGAHWSGVYVGRFLFSVLTMILLARIVHAMPEDRFHRFFYRPVSVHS